MENRELINEIKRQNRELSQHLTELMGMLGALRDEKQRMEQQQASGIQYTAYSAPESLQIKIMTIPSAIENIKRTAREIRAEIEAERERYRDNVVYMAELADENQRFEEAERLIASLGKKRSRRSKRRM